MCFFWQTPFISPLPYQRYHLDILAGPSNTFQVVSLGKLKAFGHHLFGVLRGGKSVESRFLLVSLHIISRCRSLFRHAIQHS